jgi:putative sigma-54 modulation protein
VKINITARHLKLTSAIDAYVRKKVSKASKFYDGDDVSANVVLSVEKNRQITEILFNIGKLVLRAKEQSPDIYSSIDLSMDKLEAQLRKHKEISKIDRKTKLKISKRKKSAMLEFASSDSDDEENFENKISEIKRVDLKPVNIEEAIEDMDILHYEVYMFLNRNTKKINVLYRKGNKGSLVLLEPEI